MLYSIRTLLALVLLCAHGVKMKEKGLLYREV